MAKSRDERFPSMADVAEMLTASTTAQESLVDALARTQLSGRPAAPPATSIAAPPATTRPADRTRLVASGAAVAALLAIAGVAASRARTTTATEAAAASAPPDASLPELGGPPSAVAAANGAYRDGVTAYRDANTARAARELTKAIDADPGFAPAHLRSALLAFPFDSPQRAQLQETVRLRASLGAHDRSLVDALAPLSTPPGDLVETEHRLEALVAASPKDADFTLQACRAQLALGDYGRAIGTCAEASKLDPSAAVPWRVRAVAQLRSEDIAGAASSLNECLRVSPLATSCLETLLQLRVVSGECDAALATARRLISADPDAPDGYEDLAEVLLGDDAPVESVRAALREEEARFPEDERARAKLRDDAHLAARIGHFDEAQSLLRELAQQVASSNDEEDHFDVDILRVDIDFEQGRTDDAKRVAARSRGPRGVDRHGGSRSLDLLRRRALPRRRDHARRLRRAPEQVAHVEEVAPAGRSSGVHARLRVDHGVHARRRDARRREAGARRAPGVLAAPGIR